MSHVTHVNRRLRLFDDSRMTRARRPSKRRVFATARVPTIVIVPSHEPDTLVLSCFMRIVMAVRCVGETTLLEQLGERQDFECLLTALGLCHEDFALFVRRVARTSLGDAPAYAVTVVQDRCVVRHVYLGGPAYSWTERFAGQVMRGVVFQGQQPSSCRRPCPRRRCLFSLRRRAAAQACSSERNDFSRRLSSAASTGQCISSAPSVSIIT